MKHVSSDVHGEKQPIKAGFGIIKFFKGKHLNQYI